MKTHTRKSGCTECTNKISISVYLPSPSFLPHSLSLSVTNVGTRGWFTRALTKMLGRFMNVERRVVRRGEESRRILRRLQRRWMTSDGQKSKLRRRALSFKAPIKIVRRTLLRAARRPRLLTSERVSFFHRSNRRMRPQLASKR